MVYCQLWMLITDNVSTCFGHLYAHLQEQRPRVTAYEVYFLTLLELLIMPANGRWYVTWRLKGSTKTKLLLRSTILSY